MSVYRHAATTCVFTCVHMGVNAFISFYTLISMHAFHVMDSHSQKCRWVQSNACVSTAYLPGAIINHLHNANVVLAPSLRTLETGDSRRSDVHIDENLLGKHRGVGAHLHEHVDLISNVMHSICVEAWVIWRMWKSGRVCVCHTLSLRCSRKHATSLHMYVCRHACRHVFMYEYMYVHASLQDVRSVYSYFMSMAVYFHIYIYIYIYINKQTHILHNPTCIQGAYTCAFTIERKQTRKDVHTQTHRNVSMHQKTYMQQTHA